MTSTKTGVAMATAPAKSQSTWALAWRRFKRHKLAIASSAVIFLLLLMALLAPWLAPYDPTAQPSGLNVGASYFQPSSRAHPLGTDSLGRDVLSRIIYGSRMSLLVGFVAAFSSVLIGTILGMLAGYFSSRPFRCYLGLLNREPGGWSPFIFAFWRIVSWALFYLSLYLLGFISWTLAGPGVQEGLGGHWGGNAVTSLIGLSLAWLLVAVGAIWGIRGKLGLDLDIVISRWLDFMLTIPILPLLLVLSALLRDPHVVVGQWAQQVFGNAASVFIIISIIVLFGWITTARLVRGTILSLREQEFTAAAQAMGASELRIMFRHLLPNAIAPIIVQATLQIGGAILTEAALSFLGFGIQEPVATWGNMLNNAQEYIFNAPSLALPPGVMILITVLAFNYLGDGLRDALDPRSRL